MCKQAGSANLINELIAPQLDCDLTKAIADHDTAVLYNWLTVTFSYQGISDRAAEQYLATHGGVTYREVTDAIAKAPPCPKLKSHWQFHGCRYHKTSRTCAEPEFISRCPLPRHHLRNGRLNQTAYSLFLFARDITGGDLVAWIENQLGSDADLEQQQQQLLEPLRNVFGVSDKVLTMALSSILLAAPDHYSHWRPVGAGFITIDTLVHNFLHRTGILDRLGARHMFGPDCYAPNGCAAIIRNVADLIDATAINPAFPTVFPRFVQHAIWRYCAQSGLNICNGNRINDQHFCKNTHCRLFDRCDRVSLKRLEK